MLTYMLKIKQLHILRFVTELIVNIHLIEMG